MNSESHQLQLSRSEDHAADEGTTYEGLEALLHSISPIYGIKSHEVLVAKLLQLM